MRLKCPKNSYKYTIKINLATYLCRIKIKFQNNSQLYSMEPIYGSFDIPYLNIQKLSLHFITFFTKKNKNKTYLG